MENKNKTQQTNNTTSRSWQKIQPREVTLWQRENGLYCRLASEESDDYGKKYFFPDRSCFLSDALFLIVAIKIKR